MRNAHAKPMAAAKASMDEQAVELFCHVHTLHDLHRQDGVSPINSDLMLSASEKIRQALQAYTTSLGALRFHLAELQREIDAKKRK